MHVTFIPKRNLSLILSLVSVIITVAAAAQVAPQRSLAQTSDVVISAPSLTVPSTQQTVSVPISLSTIPTIAVAAIQVEVAYDAAILALAADDCNVTGIGLRFCNAAAPGKAVFNLVNLAGIDDGEIAELTFTIINRSEGSSIIRLSLDELLDGSPADLLSAADTVNGAVTIINDPPTSTPEPTSIVTLLPTTTPEPSVTEEATATVELTAVVEPSATPGPTTAEPTALPETSPTVEPTTNGTSSLPNVSTETPTGVPVGAETAVATVIPSTPNAEATRTPIATASVEASPLPASTTAPDSTNGPGSQGGLELGIYLPVTL